MPVKIARDPLIKLRSWCWHDKARPSRIPPLGPEVAARVVALTLAMDRRTPLPDNRMSTFLAFISAAADFALTLNLKAAIVAAGFIVMLVLTRDKARE